MVLPEVVEFEHGLALYKYVPGVAIKPQFTFAPGATVIGEASVNGHDEPESLIVTVFVLGLCQVNVLPCTPFQLPVQTLTSAIFVYSFRNGACVLR
jgi:hypothetical protein